MDASKSCLFEKGFWDFDATFFVVFHDFSGKFFMNK